ncbi:MAG: FecR family protein [Acidobacteriota bacterium]|nr:FecR family protein [Acidobacteriota bacterium]
MTSRTLFRSMFLMLLGVLSLVLHPLYAGASNARIIRLSLVQGDVRLLRDSKGDPLANDKATWERAELNLPIRQHYVVATDNGRAEIEFENGAMAFLNENSTLEFFDLSLEDGALTTRLILRQGTASFYVNPARGDYFSVTGGDFTTEAASRTNFRMDNFDDGSTVVVSKGRVAVVHKGDSTVLAQGESLTVRAGAESLSANIGRAPDSDDFDRWVSGREDSVVTATNAVAQYSNNSQYTSGFADLYTYGGFYPLSGFGYGWRPYGVGLGWSPFSSGSWFLDPAFGWSFIGSQPWGWLPYHYGGWLFEPGIGWLWAPAGFGPGIHTVRYHPVTATFVRSGNSVGIVPSHPFDHGKTTLNISQGVLPLAGRTSAEVSSLNADGKWKVVKQPPADMLTSRASVAPAPARVARSVDSASRTTTGGSSITYDAKEHRFVNSNASRAAVTTTGSTDGKTQVAPNASPNVAAATVARVPAAPAPARSGNIPSASSRVMTPPPAPRASRSVRGEFPSGVSRSRGYSTEIGSVAHSPAPAPAPHASGSPRPH